MSRGKNLQEMEAGTTQSKTAINAGSKGAEPMHKLTTGIPDGQSTSWADLGGPTPDNYTNDANGPAKLGDAASPIKKVSDVVGKGAKSAEGMKKAPAYATTGGSTVSRSAGEPMKKMAKPVKEEEELEDEYDEVIAEAEKEEEDSKEDEKEDSKESKKKSKKEEDDEDDEGEMKKEEFDIEEDVNALLEGEELSEEFQEKAKVIFEAALRSKVSEIRESLEAHYEERLVEEVAEIKSVLEERADAYLEYVAQEWLEENALAVEQGLRTEMTESFIQGMKGLFEEHYVEIPEEKYDVLESMVEKLDDMETKLNEQIEKNISLNKRLAESVAEGIFDNVAEGLALSQKEKLASLAESVEFESENQYRDKLETLKESYFPSRVVSPSATTETLSEGTEIVPEFHSSIMESYLRTLSSVAKN
ncbi:MAG: T4 prohead core scaffold protein [Candidatus Nanopelagicaceae bacterium]